MIKKRIRVLIVDDSLIFREIMTTGVANDSNIEVVATATDPYMARDRIIEYEPNVMLLDVEMPKMNGIEFLKKLMPQYPIPVIVVSAVKDNVLDALKYGAVDFVEKPNAENHRSKDIFISELIVKIKIASISKVSHWKRQPSAGLIKGKLRSDFSEKVIAIGASTGGTEAIFEILKAIPKQIPGIVITQHMPPVFTKMYANRLNNSCMLEVKEAEDGDILYPGRVLLAPGDYHMILIRKGNYYAVKCKKGDKVNGHCPSVDVLFTSVAEVAKNNAIGVILTGMGADGARGLLKMRQAGAHTIGQNQETCIIYGMPKVAYERGAVERQVALNRIPHLMYSLVKGSYSYDYSGL
ncbi:protein-glutamate methylesterase/protein-glutamine glutaminase [Marinisporobacter balticus]|uniref:Protein-glutamate methylesterase/protein-glutamine glutaminase n=1 Tax=Marinisporobacter balticus TaxID=2018667 RepID=A0A4R2KHP7_9FIRM|nr:chemotaxis response regulator protein-glutamate methylesterase [Marinisporobacter balticus]TCO73133.1 two-component system chemotaxis response regulator CheB [Marinisporobacter balticus]